MKKFISIILFCSLTAGLLLLPSAGDKAHAAEPAGDNELFVVQMAENTRRAILNDLLLRAKNETQSEYVSFPDRWEVLQDLISDSKDKLGNNMTPESEIHDAILKLEFILDTLSYYDVLITHVQSFEIENCLSKTRQAIQSALDEASPLQANPFWQMDAIQDSSNSLLICAFSYNLDKAVTWAATLLASGEGSFSSITRMKLNEANAAALLVQGQTSVTVDEVGSAYANLYIACSIAEIEILVGLSAKLQETNCSARDWSDLQAAVSAAAERLRDSQPSLKLLETDRMTLTASLQSIFSNAPLGLTGTSPTSSADNSGSITGTTHLMEYKPSRATAWTAATDVSVNGLAPGAYYVRYSADSTGFDPGALALVIILPYMTTGESRNMLMNLVQMAETYLASDYSYRYQSYLSAAKDAGAAVLGDPGAAESVLITTIINLDKELDRAYLEDLITVSSIQSQEDYAPGRWQALEAEKWDAEVILQNSYASSGDIMDAIDKMSFIMATLPMFDLAYTTVQGLAQEDCTDETLALLRSALSEAAPLHIEPYWRYQEIEKAWFSLLSVHLEFLVSFATHISQANCSADAWEQFYASQKTATALLDLSSATPEQLRACTNSITVACRTIFSQVPMGLSGISPTSASNNNGIIAGTTALMEYKPHSDSTTLWTPVSGASVTDLPAGTYLVRYAKNSVTMEAGAAATVHIPAYRAPGGGGIPGGNSGDIGGNTGNTGGNAGTSSGGASGVLGAASKTFLDVHKDDWYYLAVQYVVNAGLFGGTSDELFEPNTPMTRGMLITVLYRLAGEPAVHTPNPFTDVPPGMWYTDAVIWGAQNGITTGSANHTYKPDAVLSREQLADIIYNYARCQGYDLTLGNNVTLKQYSDASKLTSYMRNAVKWACGAGLLQGKTPTTLAPKDSSSRAEVAEILRRFTVTFVKA